MCRKNLWKRLIPFSTAIVLGIGAVSLFPNNHSDELSATEGGQGPGFAACNRENPEILTLKESVDSPNKPLKILAQPKPKYTDEGRLQNVNGIVRLRVEFLSTGEIGGIQVIDSLPSGLTEQAIGAARLIRFEPQTENGKPVNASRTVEYRFTIY